MVKTRIEVFPDIDGMVDFFEELPDYDISLYQNKKWKVTPEKSLNVLSGLLPELEAQDQWDNDALYEVLKDYSAREGVKAGFTIWPVRIAVSGKAVTPAGATEIMEVLGKEESLERIRRGIRKLTDAE
jgi:glutamyl-tRNA synthetase